MTDWLVVEARRQDAELFVHTHSPADNAEYAALLGSMIASARAAYVAARTAGDHDAALTAAVEWADLAVIGGTVMDGVRAQQATIEAADMPPCIVFCDERPGRGQP